MTTIPKGTKFIIGRGYAAWYEQNYHPFVGLLKDGETIITDAESFDEDGEQYAPIHHIDRSVGCFKFPLRFAIPLDGQS